MADDKSDDKTPLIGKILEKPAGVGLVLGTIAVLAALALNFTHQVTKPAIERQHQAARERMLLQVLPPNLYDNAPLHDSITLQQKEEKAERTIYRARMGERITAVAFEATAPNGYGGPIELLIGIQQDGILSGVRVIQHKETPGLGDGIERERGDWILAFQGKSLHNPQKWAVKKDGGSFDQLTGATITPRAVVEAVHKALQFAHQHHAQLFSDPANHAQEQ